MNNKPVYVIVTPYFPTPESWRGGFCYDFVRALQRTNKYQVYVFVPGKGEDYDYQGVHVYRFRYYRAPYGLFPFLFAPINSYVFKRRLSSIGLKWQDISVYHAHETHYIYYAIHGKRLNPNLLVAFHFHSGPGIVLRNGPLGVVPIHSTFLYLYLRKCLAEIDLAVFVSKMQQRNLGKWYANGFLNEPVDIRNGVWLGKWLPTIKIKESVVLYNGIDSSLFNHQKAKVHGDFVIGCVGNITVNKDQMTLLRALVKIRDISGLRCIFVGSGPMLEDCKRYVKENGLDGIVEFKKEMDHLTLPDFYRTIDLFVLPSWIEGFNCSYMEAYGCGVPFMGCKGVSVEEAFSPEEQQKWLFDPQDDGELANKIRCFYENRQRQVLIRDFDIDVLIAEFVNHVQNMILSRNAN